MKKVFLLYSILFSSIFSFFSFIFNDLKSFYKETKINSYFFNLYVKYFHLFKMQIRTIRNDENARIGHVGDGIKKLETKEEKKAILGDISNINSTKTDENATKPKEIVDIDKLDKGKPYACSEYVKPIYENMRVTENKYVVTADYLSTQPEIDEEMRSVLVDWLVDVHYKFKLQPETLYLCINYLDRYLSKTKVKRENLQLAGVCALLLSAKYEEIYFPKIKNFVSLTDNAYTRNDILKNESIMAKALDFNFTSPTIYQFILRYLKLAQESLEYQCVSYYFAERCLMEYSLISVPPSKLAAASLLLASKYIYNEFRWVKYFYYE